MAMTPVAYQKFKREMFDFIWSELDRYENQIERTDEVPLDDLFPRLRRMRCFGLMVPEEYGGVGLSVSQYLPILAEFSKIHGGIRVVVHVHNTTAKGVAQLGSPEQKRALLPKIATGESSVAFGLTEPDAGTGRDLKSRAVRDGDHFVLNGRKHLITNSDFASHFMVFCYTDPSRGAHGISALMVDRDTPGFTIADMPPLMGCKGGQHGYLTFKDCRVPVANVLGQEGEGLLQMTVALEVSRLFIAATSLGTAERAFELSLAFAKKRVTFGKPIAERQAVQTYLAEMGTDLYALRNMITAAARKADRGERIPTEASMCKLFGLEAVGRVTDRALLVHGGVGYTQKYPIERLYRDARLNWVEEGTPTIQQLVIARNFLDGYQWEEDDYLR
jgi:alkylation response protein AidB-like acyl-CoA dehydrogenase